MTNITSRDGFLTSSATLLVNSGGYMSGLKPHGVWESSNTVKVYVEQS